MKDIDVAALKPGMTLAKTVINQDFIVLLLANTVLNDKHISILKNMKISRVCVKDEFDMSKLYQQVVALKNKDSSFNRGFEKLNKMAKKIFDEVRQGGEIKSPVILLVARILPMADDAGSINYLFNLGHMNNTLAQHCLRVAIFAGIMAKWMELEWSDIRTIVTAAFLHDVGKFKFPPTFLHRTVDDFQGTELQLYKTHCQIGRNMVRDYKFEEPIPTAVYQHHEFMNGSGFPSGIRGKDTHLFAKIIAAADAYDALISERPGHVKKTPFDAINLFAKSQFSRLDPHVCVPFVTRIKDHLIGSHVTLKDGRKGTVIFYPKDFASLPVVRLEDGTQVNLNQQRDISIVQYSIT